MCVILMNGVTDTRWSLILAEIMQEAGIRAYVGKLSMDSSTRKSYVEESASSALSSANSFVDRCRASVESRRPSERLVEPIITPRFVPTCSDELLRGLGELSNSKRLRVQSHMAESHDQVEWVQRERGKEDIDVFESVSRMLHLRSTFPKQITHSLHSRLEWSSDRPHNTSSLYFS